MKVVIFILAMLVAIPALAERRGLPVPPIPPRHPPTADAPLPNLDLFGPREEDRQSRVTLNSGINRRADPAPGFGFAPGTRYQLDNDRRFSLPGIMWHMPLP